MQDIRVAAVQMNGQLFAVDSVLDEVEQHARTAAERGAELVLFPETLVHGHAAVAEAWHIAEAVPGGPTVERLERVARELKLILSVGMSEKQNDIVYNCQALVGPDGYIGKSRKVHPSMDEGLLFTPGHEMPVFDVGKCIVGHSICYDTVFPELSRTLAIRGAEVILNPNAGRSGPWGDAEQDEREAVAQIKSSFGLYALRAVENAVFWVTCNQAGIAGYVDRYPRDSGLQPHHAGSVFVFGPDGKTLAESATQRIEPEVVVCDLQASALAEVRSSPNYAMRNRKPHLYGDVLKPANQVEWPG